MPDFPAAAACREATDRLRRRDLRVQYDQDTGRLRLSFVDVPSRFIVAHVPPAQLASHLVVLADAFDMFVSNPHGLADLFSGLDDARDRAGLGEGLDGEPVQLHAGGVLPMPPAGAA